MKIKKLFLLGVALILLFSLFSFAGCGNVKEGTFYRLREAYEQGLLTQDDLKNICYHRHGKVYVYDSIEWKVRVDTDYAPTPKNPEVLDKITEQAIKQTMVSELLLETLLDGTQAYPNVTAESFTITGYYGTYNGCVALFMCGFFDYACEDGGSEKIADVMFYYGDANYIRIWKENK